MQFAPLRRPALQEGRRTLFGEVHEALGPHAAEALGPHPGEAGQTLVLWYDTEHKENDVDGAAAFILRRRVPGRGRMRVFELPAATMAATVHQDDPSYVTEIQYLVERQDAQ